MCDAVPIPADKQMDSIRRFLGDRLKADYQPPPEPHHPVATRIRSRLDRWRMPYVTALSDFDDRVRFEIASPTERHRIVEHGGETGYLTLVLSLLKQGDVLYDVGVCVGLVALHAARRCRVVGFEPDPVVRERFARNLELNPGLEVELHPYAVGDADGTAILHLNPGTATSASLRRQRDEPDSVEVKMRTLDTLVFDDGLPTPTAIKLDIEGAELAALRGAGRVLSEVRPKWLFVEVHPAFLPAFGGTANDVLDLVDGYGYQPHHAEVRGGQIHLIFEG